MKHIGAKIKNLRQNRNCTQMQVAQALAISVSALSNIEKGVTDINISRLHQLAEFFEVKTIDLISTFTSSENLKQLLELECKDKLIERDEELIKLQNKVIALYEQKFTVSL